MKVYNDLFCQIITTENLFSAWDEFKLGKQTRPDVMEFEWHLEENIFTLYRELRDSHYKHGSYRAFYIQDPKQRLIHKATVRDRIFHHAVFKVLNPIFELTFIANSFSCRVGKGTHKGVKILARILLQVSQNHTADCFALKCDIYKFFASVDHKVLTRILVKRIKDQKTIDLLELIIGSFHTVGRHGQGLPIGNLTSQLFANIYMNEVDQFIKHQLRLTHYVRYTDDFIVVSQSSDELQKIVEMIQEFLSDNLRLKLHPAKISIRKYNSGIDFLGYVILPHHTTIRSKTKRRMLSKINNSNLDSYLGVCCHANAYGLQKTLRTKVAREINARL